MASLRGGSLAQRVRYALLGLEDKDLEHQATWGLRDIIGQSKSAKDVKCIIKDLLTGLDNANVSARRNRYLLAGHAVERCPADAVSHIVPFVMTKVNRQLGEEKQQPTLLAVGQLVEQTVERLMLHLVEVSNGGTDDANEFSNGWLTNTLVQGLIRAAAKSPDKRKVVMAFAMLHGVISALRDWTHVPGVVPMVLFCFKHIVQAMLHGLFGCRVAEAYRPLQRCMEILGVHAPSETVGTALKVCVIGAKDKDDWQVRKSAMETLTVTAAAVQIHEQSEQGEWALKMSDGLDLLIQKKTEIIKVLLNAKYDKIIHVRKAAAATKVEMDNIPDPSQGKVPNVTKGDTSAHAGMLASQRRSMSFDGHPSSSKSVLRSRSCDMASAVPSTASRRKQRSRRDSQSMDTRLPTSINAVHHRSVSGPEDSALPLVGGDDAQKKTIEEREKRAVERKARMEELRMQIRRAKSAKPFSGHGGRDYEVHVFAPERQRNHFDVSILDSDQRCPSAPPLTPTGELEASLGNMVVEGPSCGESASQHVQSQLDINGDGRLAAWVSDAQGGQEHSVEVLAGGTVSQQYRHMDAAGEDFGESSGHKYKSQASFEELSLHPPAILSGAADSIRPSTSNGSMRSSTLATLLDVSEPASPASDFRPPLEPTSPAVSVGSSSPLCDCNHFFPGTGEPAGKLRLKATRQITTGTDQNSGLRQANCPAIDRELSQVQQLLEDVIVREEGVIQVHGTNGLVQQGRTDMALLTQGSTNAPGPPASPKMQNTPLQAAASRDEGRDEPLRQVAGLAVLTECATGKINAASQFEVCGRTARSHTQNDSNITHCALNAAGAVLERDRSDTAEKLDALETMSESSIDIESPGRRSGRWRKSFAPPRCSDPPACTSPEQMLNYTIATLKQCMHDLPKADKEKRHASLRANVGASVDDVSNGGHRASPPVGPKLATCHEEPCAPGQLMPGSPSGVPEGRPTNEPASLMHAARDHADEVLQYYKTRENIQLKFLEDQYKRNIANMEAMFERDKAFLRNATQKAIKEEVSLFSRTYLPHVASLAAGTTEIDTQQVPQGSAMHIR